MPQYKPLPQRRAESRHEEPELREQIMRATLIAAGELGYCHSTVAVVLERYGGYRLQFYRQFGSLTEAYEHACATHLERLASRLLKAGASGSSWRAGLRAALAELQNFVCQQPDFARGLLVEIHVARGRALVHHKEVLKRLSHALDSARRETRSRHSPPPLAALFMVNAIESTVRTALAKKQPERLRHATPELEQLVSVLYFGRGGNEV